MFFANETNIKRLYRECTQSKGKGGETAKRKTIELVSSQRVSNVSLGVQQAYYCLGMSKMTVKEERPEAYNVLKHAEFIEYLARVAEVRFEHSPLSLAKKIEMTLDLILPYFNMRRVPVGEGDVDRHEVESDDSIDIDSLDPDLLLFSLQSIIPAVTGKELSNKKESPRKRGSPLRR